MRMFLAIGSLCPAEEDDRDDNNDYDDNADRLGLRPVLSMQI